MVVQIPAAARTERRAYLIAWITMALTGLLSGLASEPGLLQRAEHVLIIEIAVHCKGLCAFGGSVAGDAVDFAEGCVDSLNAFGAAEMHVLNVQ